MNGQIITDINADNLTVRFDNLAISYKFIELILLINNIKYYYYILIFV